MARKSVLQTVRLSPEERSAVAAYLRQNPVFESFSALARAATLTFIGAWADVKLRPVGPESRPGFLWDHGMTAAQAREILARPGLSETKRWLMGRILSEARFEEVFSYLELEQIRRALPSLRLPPKVRDRWTYAVRRWSEDG